ncbi:MAG: SseB family protein [Clostridium sp.]|nr:SseB family protein [Clostridium sp.]
MGLKDMFKKNEESVDENINVTEEKVQESTEAVETNEVHMEEEQQSTPAKGNEEPVQEAIEPKDITSERKQEIGPIVFKTEIEESDLAPLTIQETIFILCSVDHFNEEGGIENYQQKCEMLDKVLAKKLAEQEVLYMTFDRATGAPFITQGCVEIYTEKAFVLEACQHYATQYRAIEPVEFVKSDSNLPDKLNLFEYLHVLGMEHILVDNGKYKTVVERGDILPIEDKKDKTYNPKLRLAMIEFFEEARWMVNYEEREENMKTKEKRMLDELKTAKYLIPMSFPDQTVEGMENEVVLQDGMNMMLPKLETQDQVAFTPMFTDWMEFGKIYPKDKWNGLVVTFEQALGLVKEMGIVINPMGENLIMNQQSFEALKQMDEMAENGGQES